MSDISIWWQIVGIIGSIITGAGAALAAFLSFRTAHKAQDYFKNERDEHRAAVRRRAERSMSIIDRWLPTVEAPEDQDHFIVPDYIRDEVLYLKQICKEEDLPRDLLEKISSFVDDPIVTKALHAGRIPKGDLKPVRSLATPVMQAIHKASQSAFLG